MFTERIFHLFWLEVFFFEKYNLEVFKAYYWVSKRRVSQFVTKKNSSLESFLVFYFYSWQFKRDFVLNNNKQ